MRCFGIVLLVAFVQLFFLPTAAAAGIHNGSFESGTFGGWRTIGTMEIRSAGVGIEPPAGHSQALIESHSSVFGVAATRLVSFLGLSTAHLRKISTAHVIDGSGMKQTLRVHAGDVLSFDWNFLTNEDEPDHANNDFAFVTITPAILSVLADTKSDLVEATVPFKKYTTYHTFSHTFEKTGRFMLGIGVVDVGDNDVTSGLLIDNVRLTHK